MAELSREQMDRLTRRGALLVLEELEREAAAIRRAFPGLAGVGRRRRRRASVTASAGVAVPRRRPAMSAAARKAVSERMKKYWAERRKAKAKK